MVVSTRSKSSAKSTASPKSKEVKPRRTALPKPKPPPLPPTSRQVSHPSPPSTTSEPTHKDKTIILPILHTLLSRLTSASSTICPSQVARRLTELHPGQYPDWRAMMDPVREIVWQQAAEGVVEVTQGGVVRTLEEREGLKGPIRVRRGPGWSAPED